jgi:hypothetical protein
VTVLVPGGTFAAPARRITGLAFQDPNPGSFRMYERNSSWSSGTAGQSRRMILEMKAPAGLFPTSPAGSSQSVTFVYGASYSLDAYGYANIIGPGNYTLGIVCASNVTTLNSYHVYIDISDTNGESTYPWPAHTLPESIVVEGTSISVGALICEVPLVVISGTTGQGAEYLTTQSDMYAYCG